ncbi:MAG: transporter substrate-binding domain-containing protein [Clostridiales Family XIII bacterium]|jgi:polar amino acid transport system substrate-binding protein|nr:transporter substrate-binding domain-containing protein [Clostridiales Family XIII bacterium]
MKKFGRLALAVALSVAMVLALVACGSKDESTSGGDTEKTYIIYSDNAFAPFEYLDPTTNEYTGVDMDLLAAIAEDQGFAYEIKNEGFDAAMGAVQSGQADGMIAGMTIKEERKETFDFSDGYFEDGQIFVVAADSDIDSLEDLNGTVVAVKTSTAGADYAASIADEYGFTLQYYEDSPTMYTAVINGVNVACFEDFSVIGWAIKNDGVKLKTVGDVINSAPYGFAVKKGENAELIELFNAGLANIKENGKYDEILAKYGY